MYFPHCKSQEGWLVQWHLGCDPHRGLSVWMHRTPPALNPTPWRASLSSSDVAVSWMSTTFTTPWWCVLSGVSCRHFCGSVLLLKRGRWSPTSILLLLFFLCLFLVNEWSYRMWRCFGAQFSTMAESPLQTLHSLVENVFSPLVLGGGGGADRNAVNPRLQTTLSEFQSGVLAVLDFWGS